MRMPDVARGRRRRRARRAARRGRRARSSACSPGTPAPELAAVRAYLDAAGIARQKWPEHVRVGRRVPAHRERQGAEVRAAPAAARRRTGRSDVTGLLDGMRVLDAGIWRPVPHATQMLADLGAEVLKIEPPGGDPMRTFPQLFRDVAGHKRSIELDLRSDEGRARALELVADADVFCEGWRPGRRGAARPELRRRARGQSVDHLLLGVGLRPDRSERRAPGPRRELPGARGRDRARARAKTPAIPRVPIADLAAGTIAAFCICAAWAKRIQTGEGERIDVAMADVVASWSGTSSGNVLRGASRTDARLGGLRRVPRAPTVGGSRWPSSPRITSGGRCATRSSSPPTLARARSSRTPRPLRRVSGRDRRRVRGLAADDALERLTRAGAPVAPVLDPAEMTANEQFRVARGRVRRGRRHRAARLSRRLAEHPPRRPGPTPEVDGIRAAGRDGDERDARRSSSSRLKPSPISEIG